MGKMKRAETLHYKDAESDIYNHTSVKRLSTNLSQRYRNLVYSKILTLGFIAENQTLQLLQVYPQR